jgi:hypothetical protein
MASHDQIKQACTMVLQSGLLNPLYGFFRSKITEKILHLTKLAKFVEDGSNLGSSPNMAMTCHPEMLGWFHTGEQPS